MSNENKNTTPAATYEDKVKFIEEVIELTLKLDKLKGKMDKMRVEDSPYWDKYKESINDAWAALRLSAIKSVAITLQR
jgi:hypothetical protein